MKFFVIYFLEPLFYTENRISDHNYKLYFLKKHTLKRILNVCICINQSESELKSTNYFKLPLYEYAPIKDFKIYY